MSHDQNKTPQEHQQPTGGTTIPKHNQPAPRMHQSEEQAPESADEPRSMGSEGRPHSQEGQSATPADFTAPDDGGAPYRSPSSARD